MSINRYNGEGYYDPTAYEALASIELAARRRGFMPPVFICSPFAGDVERNLQKVREYSRFAVARYCIPIAPHLLFPQFMNDNDPAQRSLAIFMGLVLLGKCYEIWVFGDDVSSGMSVEIAKARSRGMVIRRFNERCEEVDG